VSWWTRYHATWRAELILQLGGVCRAADAACQGGLELDHIHGRDYKLHKLSSHMRVKRYRAEAAAGLLQVLCRHHNAKKNQRDLFKRKSAPAPEAVPAWVTEESQSPRES